MTARLARDRIGGWKTLAEREAARATYPAADTPTITLATAVNALVLERAGLIERADRVDRCLRAIKRKFTEHDDACTCGCVYADTVIDELLKERA